MKTKAIKMSDFKVGQWVRFKEEYDCHDMPEWGYMFLPSIPAGSEGRVVEVHHHPRCIIVKVVKINTTDLDLKKNKGRRIVVWTNRGRNAKMTKDWSINCLEIVKLPEPLQDLEDRLETQQQFGLTETGPYEWGEKEEEFFKACGLR